MLDFVYFGRCLDWCCCNRFFGDLCTGRRDMSHNEFERVGELSSWYLNEQLDFDKRMIEFRYKALKPKLRPGYGLELGSAEGEMTRFLISDFQELTVVDGAGDLLERIPEYSNVIKVCSLFENF